MARWRRGGIVIERSLVRERGVAMLRQHFQGNDTRVIVTHRAGLRALVEVHAGSLVFPLASGEVVGPERFVLSVPAYSVLPIRFEHAKVLTGGTGALRVMDDHRVPAIEVARHATARDAIEKPCETLVRLDADVGIAASLVAARAELHAVISERAPVRAAAARAGMGAETFTRAFAAAYGITPKQYCQRARLFDAAIFLFDGTSVIDAALRAGFNDLTRFYVQFRRLLGATPGGYARIGNRQDASPAAS